MGAGLNGAVLSCAGRMPFATLLLLLPGGLLLACVGPSIHLPDVPRLNPAGCRAFQEQHGICIGADPYHEKQRIIESFGRDLTAAEILPIFVSIRNRSLAPIKLRSSHFTLLGVDDVPFMQVSPSAVRNPVSAEAVESRAGAVNANNAGVLTVPIGLLLFSPLAIAMNSGAADLEEIARNIQRRALAERILFPSEESQGFLYFKVRNGASVKALTMHVVNLDDQELRTCVLRLDGPER